MEGIWEVAKKIEIEGKNYYMRLAKESDSEEMAGVFHFLAGQEEEHFDIFMSMQDGKKPARAETKKASIIAKEAFIKIAKDFNNLKPFKQTEDLFRKAISLEEETIKYYLNLLEKLEEPEQQAAVKAIIEEEEDHKAVMESMIEFTKGPKVWLENMEF